MSELKEFWDEVVMKVPRTVNGSGEVIWCALLCVACDLPAGRKVCGFLSLAAGKGCSKCYKLFYGSVGNNSVCYAGFDRALWTPRSHRQSVQVIMKCVSKTEIAKKESELGCRYSVLLERSYFDAATMLAIDPIIIFSWVLVSA